MRQAICQRIILVLSTACASSKSVVIGTTDLLAASVDISKTNDRATNANYALYLKNLKTKQKRGHGKKEKQANPF